MTRRSRRSLLRTAGTALTVGMAGCLGDDGRSSPTAEAEVIRDTSFEGQYLVVELASDHEVSKLNLIGPDGSAFAQTSVAAGETRAQLKLLAIDPEPSYEHYTPGEHELIAVGGSREVSEGLVLRPKFELIDVQQYQDPKYDPQLGNLSFTFKNTGSAPSWVYDIVFSGAPNFEANIELSDSPGVPIMTYPDEDSNFVIEPGGTQKYVSANPPFVFDNEENRTCSGDYQVTATIGFPTKDPLNIPIRAEMAGDVVDTGMTTGYTCSNIVVELLTGSN